MPSAGGGGDVVDAARATPDRDRDGIALAATDSDPAADDGDARSTWPMKPRRRL